MDSVAKSDEGCREDKDETNGTNSDLENTDEPVDEVPIFLRPELRDFFLSLASMLDIKSFVKLAMTSKEMYQRCLEDNYANIRIVRGTTYVKNKDDGGYIPELCFLDQYNKSCADGDSVRKFGFKMNMGTLFIEQGMRDYSFIHEFGEYIKEVRVIRVNELHITRAHPYIRERFNYDECEAAMKFIKDFKVKCMHVGDICGSSFPYIRSILQQNLNSVSFHVDSDSPVPVNFLLEASSLIPEVTFTNTDRFSTDEFIDLLWRIHAGSFRSLIIPDRAVILGVFAKLPFDHDGPLPEDRPLLFVRSTPQRKIYEYWLLLENGCCMKCVDNRAWKSLLKISKCEPCDFPPILLNDENIMNELIERHPTVYCNSDQFHKFMDMLPMLDSSPEGPLPKERPLYFKVSENHFWMLDEDDNLMSCTWENGCAVWETSYINAPVDHPALVKHMFWKLVKDNTKYYVHVYCKSPEEFDSWLEGIKLFNFNDYDSPLPDERPLVFERRQGVRIILFQEYCVRCEFIENFVHIRNCSFTRRPWILNNSEMVEILQCSLIGKSSRDFERRALWKEDSDYDVDLQIFREGFDLLKTLPYDYFHPQERVLVYSKTTKNSDDEIIEESFTQILIIL